MNSTALAIVLGLVGAVADDTDAARRAPDPALAEIILYDRLDQTFRLLNALAIQTYLDHFQDKPEALATVEYYAGRLAELEESIDEAFEHYRRSLVVRYDHAAAWLSEHDGKDGALTEEERRQIRLRLYKALNPLFLLDIEGAAVAALKSARVGDVESLEESVQVLTDPRWRRSVSRNDDDQVSSAAICVLHDPCLFWVQRRLAELRSGRKLPSAPAALTTALHDVHAAVRVLRDGSDDRELSLRKFLDKHRATVWQLGWLYRCRGLELERAGNATAGREHFVRAWAIGDALFPASERGRLDKFDPVFLAELGDVYARLGRYDLMLRYMYSDAGLPARFELARPIAELARVAESVRLARADDPASTSDDEALPETVSQILFELPVEPSSRDRVSPVGGTTTDAGSSHMWGWVFLSAGAAVLIGGLAWAVSRSSRRRAEI